jgi:O-antigen/teichoic acid export membrane protein
MSDVARVAKNTMFLMSAQVISLVMGIVYIKLSTTYLGTSGFGELSFAMSFTQIFASVMDLGIGWILARDVSRDKSLLKKYLDNMLSIRLAMTIVVLASIIILINLRDQPQQTVYIVYVVALATVFSSITSLFYGVFQSFERMEYQAISMVLTYLVLIAGAVISKYMGFDVLAFSIIYCLAYLIVLIYCTAVCVSKFALPYLCFDFSFWKVSLKESLPFGISGILYTFYYSIGPVFLYYMKGETEVGIFSVGFKLFLTVLVVPTMFGQALFPVMSRYFVSSSDVLKKAFEKYLKYLAYLAIPMVVGTTLLADKIVYIFSSGQFTDSIIVLQISIWAAAFIFISNPYMYLIISSNAQKTLLKISMVCAFICLITNLVLMPGYGYIGASIAIVITEFCSLVMYAVVAWRIGYRVSKKTCFDLAKSVVASLVMGGYLILFTNYNILFQVATAVPLYFAILYLFRGLDKEDIDIIKSFINREKIKSIVKIE